MTVADLAREFAGEGTYVEFKQGVSATRIQEAAVAFSNSDGGVYLLGVTPSGDVVGVAHPGERAKDVHQALRDTRNPGRYDVHELLVGDKTVLVVAVARRHEGFAQTTGGAVLVRRGASNVALLGDDLSRFLARRTFQHFELTATSVPLDDADHALVERLANLYAWPPGNDAADRLVESGFAALDAGRLMLTVTGALLLLTEPATIGGRYYIELRRYGPDDVDPNRTWQIRGPADAQVQDATRAIIDELGTVSAVLGADRVDMPRIPPRAIREAVANAVAHRSYEHTGAAVRVDIYPAYVAITSPGGLPEPVTLHNLRFQQAARNDRLLGALRRMGLAEDLGKGIDRIEDDMANELLQPPTFDDDGSFFSVTLRLGGVVTPRERAWVRGLVQQGRLDARSAMIVVAAARDGSVTNGDVRTLFNLDSTQARSLLQSLVTAGVFVQRGERGGATYHLAAEIGVPARIRFTDTELEDVVLELAQHGSVTNAQIRERTGLDRQEVVRLLRRLVARGALIQVGERRGTRYWRPD